MGELQFRKAELDGMRGVAALVVAVTHFVTLLFPALYFGAEGHPASLLSSLAGSPFYVLINGSFAVYVFFILSGYVIAASASRQPTELIPNCAARLLRLSLPCAAALAFSYLLLDLRGDTFAILADRLNHWWARMVAPAAAPRDLMIEMLGGYYLFGKSELDGVLWTMQRELLGSLGIFCAFYVLRAPVLLFGGALLSIAALIAFNLEPQFYICFPIGALMFLSRDRLRQAPALGAVFFVLGMVLGGKPYLDAPSGSFYSWFPNHWLLYFWPVGAASVVLSTQIAPSLRRPLCTGPCQFLGRISFGLYLVHMPILLFVAGELYPIGGVAAVATYLPISIAAAYIFTKIVDEPSVRAARKARALITKSPGVSQLDLRAG